MIHVELALIAILLAVANWQLWRAHAEHRSERLGQPSEKDAQIIPTNDAVAPRSTTPKTVRILKRGALHHVCLYGSTDHIDALADNTGILSIEETA